MVTAAQEAQQGVTQSYAGDQPLDEEQRQRALAIVNRLEREAEKRVSNRSVVEQRWLEDLRQFHGKYDDKTTSDLKEAKKSTLFVNQTRQKTNACEARLSDMLFPTDDRNWGIEPTPVPELTVEAEETAMAAAAAKQKVAENPEDPALQQAAAAAADAQAKIQARMDEARKRSRSMQAEIEDQLRECNYQIQAREVIRDACRLGTGIMKGPVVGERNRRKWELRVATVNGQQTQEYALASVEDKRPVFWRVDPWNFFPDMDATSPEDSEGDFERHLLNKKQLRRLARQPGFDQNAIRRLLTGGARSSLPTYISDLRSITGAYNESLNDRYHVWEYHGPLEQEDLRDLVAMFGREELLEDFDPDPLKEINAVIWFCQGELLKLGLHYLDSGESIYSIFNLEKDESSVFGFGVPYMMRDSQKALAAGWRMMMDNGGAATGPQIVIDDDVIEPVNGVWAFEPRKLWRKKKTAPPNAKPFETFDIPMHQAELANIIQMAKQFIDDETAVTVLAQGEQGTHTTQTAHGMSILMNSVNVVFRRIVKNWDDDMTTPNIRRLYDWNMQFSPKAHIKGDFEVDARGTSVLLVREIQSANLLALLTNFAGHPVVGKYLKKEGLPVLRRLVQTMMLPADEVVKTDTEIAEDEARAREQPQPPDPNVLNAEAHLEAARLQAESRERVALINRETAAMNLAAQGNIKLEELQAMFADHEAERAHKERQLAVEVAVEERQARRGNDQKGSGGYIA